MMKYEEEHYLYENIKDKIYPWVKESLVDHKALNGKYISDKDTPIVSFAGDLMVIFVIERCVSGGGWYPLWLSHRKRFGLL